MKFSWRHVGSVFLKEKKITILFLSLPFHTLFLQRCLAGSVIIKGAVFSQGHVFCCFRAQLPRRSMGTLAFLPFRSSLWISGVSAFTADLGSFHGEFCAWMGPFHWSHYVRVTEFVSLQAAEATFAICAFSLSHSVLALTFCAQPLFLADVYQNRVETVGNCILTHLHPLFSWLSVQFLLSMCALMFPTLNCPAL